MVYSWSPAARTVGFGSLHRLQPSHCIYARECTKLRTCKEHSSCQWVATTVGHITSHRHEGFLLLSCYFPSLAATKAQYAPSFLHRSTTTNQATILKGKSWAMWWIVNIVCCASVKELVGHFIHSSNRPCWIIPQAHNTSNWCTRSGKPSALTAFHDTQSR